MTMTAVERGEIDPEFDPTAIPTPIDERTAESPRRRIVVIGAGPGGIIAALRLRQAGYEDVTVLERADGVGGTWLRNRYPGAACDVQAHLYSFSFAPNPDWSRPYAEQPELLAYFNRVVDEFGLRSGMRFGVNVTAVDWDDDTAQWRVTIASGEFIDADIVISAIGMFNDLSLPDVEGLDSFAGPLFHTAQWPENLDLAGLRVGVIGSAASAVQLVPPVAEVASHLTVFQRSPQWVLPKLDDPFTDEQRASFATDSETRLAVRRLLWDRVEGAILFSPDSVRISEAAGLWNLEAVEDPETRERLTPTTPFGCQRPLTASNYYPTFNRPDVELVTDAIARVVPEGVVTTDGRVHEFDVLVIATGFAATRYLSSIEVTGREGQRLVDTWNDGAQAFLGIATSGFPNLFQLYGPNTNNGSIIYMLECQVDLVVRSVQMMDAERLSWIDVRPEVMVAYNEAIQRDIEGIDAWMASCHNYYRSPSGRVVTQWPHSMAEYRRRSLEVDDDVWDRARLT
jgi:cation diffusion facilitator CzcD-associated flavoprotein CzcO